MIDVRDHEFHDRMAHDLLRRLERSGFTGIAANVVDYDAPSKICWAGTSKGHIPDATAVKDGGGYLFAVDAADSPASADTLRRWKLFEEHARRFGKTFVIAVPRDCSGATKEQLEGQGIGAEVWEVPTMSRAAGQSTR